MPTLVCVDVMGIREADLAEGLSLGLVHMLYVEEKVFVEANEGEARLSDEAMAEEEVEESQTKWSVLGL